MRRVSPFEANLLRFLRCLLRQGPLEPALPLLLEAQPRPPCLGKDAVALVRETLAQGCVLRLARLGGWRLERHLRGGRIVEGRLWERTPPEALGLEFSRASLGFLLWLTASGLGDEPKPWRPLDSALTLGDRLLVFFAHETLRPTEVGKVLREQPACRSNGLCWLAYPEDFVDNPREHGPNWPPWGEGVGPCLVEALQPLLEARWVEVERSKGRIASREQMRALGQAQGRILDAFLDHVEQAGRRDLARFLLRAADQLLGRDPPARAWIGRLNLAGLRLAERLEVHGEALAVLRRLDRLRGWDREARSTGYFDEGYAAGQLWKADWEQAEGETLWSRARAIVQQLEPM